MSERSSTVPTCPTHGSVLSTRFFKSGNSYRFCPLCAPVAVDTRGETQAMDARCQGFKSRSVPFYVALSEEQETP